MFELRWRRFTFLLTSAWKGQLVINFLIGITRENTTKRLNQLQVKGYRKDIQHYVMHVYSICIYTYIYDHHKQGNDRLIYISIYEGLTTPCYACILYLDICMSIIRKQIIFIYKKHYK